MRLVTWNIRGGLGIDNRRSIQRVADVIRECRADIVCLQEVHQRLPQSRLWDQPRILSELLEMKGYFLPSYRIGFGGFGNMILTNLPVRSFTRHPLPNSGERQRLRFLFERRSLLTADIVISARIVRVMTTHFSLNQFDRVKAVERVRNIAADAAMPVILCGDLNATPSSEEMRYLDQQCGFRDAGASGDHPTFRADRPDARIDYVWSSARFAADGVSVVATLASDHLPVLVDLDVRAE
jgi:endonuclease/exonuclease/phosphatase family metal-dependent hydrolase